MNAVSSFSQLLLTTHTPPPQLRAKLSKLQFEMDALRGMDGVSASEYLSDRERAQMRSLQQRLEQVCFEARSCFDF